MINNWTRKEKQIIITKIPTGKQVRHTRGTPVPDFQASGEEN